VWLVTALAIFFAARVIAGSKATYARALGLTLLGVIIISVSSIMLEAFLGSIIGSILVFVIWLALIKSFFQTGWLGAIGISILAVFMLIVIMVILGFLFALIGLPFIQPPIQMLTQSF
jgi:hypothetical protein